MGGVFGGLLIFSFDVINFMCWRYLRSLTSRMNFILFVEFPKKFTKLYLPKLLS